MCLKLFNFGRPDTLESLKAMIQRMAKNRGDAEMCRLWYEIDQMTFHELGEIFTDVFNLGAQEVAGLVKAAYPTIADFRLPDTVYTFTNLEQMARILQRDFTWRVKYVSESFDCDDFADLLKSHLSLYYGLSSFTLWGEAGGGSHACVMSILRQADGRFEPRLIEPQSGVIFSQMGPCGRYTPRILVQNYGQLIEEATNGKPG
jgi:hypothetical protein